MENAEDPALLASYKNADLAGQTNPPTILALGVGGGGCNAVAYMTHQGVKGVDFVVLNTDQQALLPMPVATKVLLGPKTCGGYGAGGKPEVGQAAAEESVPEIEKLLTPDVKMVFVTAGMGGGTGTGAAPIVAGVAKSRGVLTVGIVTIPFFFEGMNKIKSAIEGAARLQKNVDAMLIINNDRLASIYPDMAWDEAFSKADDILTTAARTISDMVTTLANINIDMRDVDTCLRDGRTALISVGYGEGENRMSQAIQSALHSPLLCDTNIMSAKELLFAFYYSHELDPKLKVSEAAQANNLVREINKSVHIKFGWGFDDTLGNKIKFTILASGFDVSVDTDGTTIEIIEGKDNTRPDEVDDISTLSAIADAYGHEKVDELIRSQETQSYYILNADQLDSDEAIAMVERTPAYKRDKRKAAQAAGRSAAQAPTSATFGARQPSPQNNQGPKPNSNNISFSLDDTD